MTNYELTLYVRLPHADDDAQEYLRDLYEAGFDDGVVGVGLIGHLAMKIEREAESAEAAITRVKKDIEGAISGATLLRVEYLRL